MGTELVRLTWSQFWSSATASATRATLFFSQAFTSSGISVSLWITYVSKPARAHSSKVNLSLFHKMRREIRARAVSPSPTMYLGYCAESGFSNIVVWNGVELQFCTKPDLGLVTCGSSLKAWYPCHSVCEMLPSTGLDQSNC